jgi:enediyne polyketide synthase
MQAIALASREVDLWIEVGPGCVLTSLASECGVSKVIAMEVGGISLTGLLEVLGTAWTMGAALDPTRLFEDRFTRPFALEWRPLFIRNPCESGAESVRLGSGIVRSGGWRARCRIAGEPEGPC